MNCSHCNASVDNLVVRGRNRKSKVRTQCRKCGKYSTHKAQEFDRQANVRKTRVLLIDIETMYMEVRGIWGLKTEYIQPDRIVKDWSVLCYGAKWLFESEVFGEVVTPEEVANRDEASIIKSIWNLLDEAHVVVTQNGIDFDMRSLNAKFLKHGLPPPSKYLNVDTKRIAKQHFRLPSYKLDYLAKVLLGLDGKMKMVIEDWDACAEGDKRSLDKMLTYCKMDVAPLLEDLYLKLLPWASNHPNLNLYIGDKVEKCPRCLGEIEEGKPYPTPQGLWKGFRCKRCGGIGRYSGEKNRISSTIIKS